MAENIDDILLESEAYWLEENIYSCGPLVGSLMYLSTHTGPKIFFFAVEILSRSVSSS